MKSHTKKHSTFVFSKLKPDVLFTKLLLGMNAPKQYQNGTSVMVGSQWVKALKMERRRMDWAHQERINLDKYSWPFKIICQPCRHEFWIDNNMDAPLLCIGYITDVPPSIFIISNHKCIIPESLIFKGWSLLLVCSPEMDLNSLTPQYNPLMVLR